MSDQAAWGDEIVQLAELFHNIYEEEARRFGWKSQMPVPFGELPESNAQTMLCTVARVRREVCADRDELRMELARVTQERDEKDAECKTLTKENARLVNKSNDWQEVSEILGDQLGSALRERDEALSRIERAKELAKREPRADLDKDAYFNHLQFRDALLAILEGDTE